MPATPVTEASWDVDVLQTAKLVMNHPGFFGGCGLHPCTRRPGESAASPRYVHDAPQWRRTRPSPRALRRRPNSP